MNGNNNSIDNHLKMNINKTNETNENVKHCDEPITYFIVLFLFVNE